MADTAHVKGLDALQKYLDTLPKKVEANIMRGALRAGMRVVSGDAKGRVRHRSGDLSRNLKISTKLFRGIVKCMLAAKGFEGMKAIWLEFGTRAHLISVQEGEKQQYMTRRGELKTVSMTTINRMVLQIGNRFVGKTVQHPGARPFPFMRPALDSQAQNALVAAGNYIKTRLESKHGIDTSDVTVEAG